MKTGLRALLGLTAVFAVGCSRQSAPQELPAPPRILSFEVSAAEVKPGESVTLQFTAENAREVVLVDHTGAPVELSGDASSGEATVTLDETSFFLLRALGDGGRDSAARQVAVGEDLRRVYLIAVPPEVEAGEPVELLWGANAAASAGIVRGDGSEVAIDAAAGQGVVELVPERTETFTLTASGVTTPAPLSATATARVRPVLQGFAATPVAANIGEEMTLQWGTRGATELTLTEATFGELVSLQAPGDTSRLDDGSHAFTIPDVLPSGGAVTDGRPLRFTLTVKTTDPAVTLTRVIESYVGDAPRIVSFDAPDAVTEGRPLTLAWETFNAARVQVLAEGGVIHEPLTTDTAAIAKGSITLPAPAEDTTFSLRIWGHLGAQVTESRLVSIVKQPVISTFTVPATVSDPSQAVNAEWTTQNAVSVSLRLFQGPVLFRTEDLAQVASGSHSLYLGVQSMVVLEAFNAAGDKTSVARPVTVIAPGVMTASPSPSLTGETVKVTWNVDPASTASLVGIPTGLPVPNNPPTIAVDLNGHADALPLSFDDSNDSVAAIDLSDSFVFPFAGSARSSFHVSTNGFVAFAPTDSRPENAQLDSTTAPIPALIAPFWDDLELGAQGQVLYLLEGESFPRRLIVQWDKVQLFGDATTVLTFQVQLFETGEMEFAYLELTGAGAAGEGASVGYRLNGTLAHELGTGAPILATGDERLWFSSAPLSGELNFVPAGGGAFTAFGRRIAGGYVAYPAKVNPLSPGDVLVSEVMVLPEASATAGQWVELANATEKTIDLSGTVLTSTTSSWTVPEGVTLPPRSFLVVGQSSDQMASGGAPVALEWSGFTPDNAAGDTVSLTVNGTPLSSLSYTAGDLVGGASIQAPERAIDATGAPVSCTRKLTFGGNGAIGTPGFSNEVCFEYSLAAIPGGFEDISVTGTQILASESDYTGTGTLPLEVPFPYFGQPQSEVHVSMVGFVTFGQALSSAFDDPNDTVPGSPDPNGVVAPFWDQLVRNTNGLLLMERKASYTIISWQDFRIYAQSGSSLNFQVKLFDSGVIEFHYGTMTPYTTTAGAERASGSSATTWIERLDGSGALPVNIDTAYVIQPNTAYRFAPNL